MLTALKPSLVHDRKHVLRLWRYDYMETGLNLNRDKQMYLGRILTTLQYPFDLNSIYLIVQMVVARYTTIWVFKSGTEFCK